MSTEIASFEKVKGAVVHLRAQGVAATADRVIAHLGGGSKVTVLRHLKTVRDSQAQEESLPQAVLEMARSALSDVFAAGAKAEAERSAAGLMQLTTSIRELDAQVDELAAENTVLRETIGALTSNLNNVEVQTGELKAALVEATRELQTVRSELAQERGTNAKKMASLMARLETSLPGILKNDGQKRSNQRRF